MKKFTAPIFALFFVLFLGPAAFVEAQTVSPQTGALRRQQQSAQSQFDQQQPEKRPNLLQLLNLTPDQVQQIRDVNQETRATVRAANMRQRAARRALDAAIYDDSPNQAEVEARTREFVAAQAEAVKLRTSVEFRVRQILAPEQLARFRELRRDFELKLRQQRPAFQSRPFRRMNNKPF